MARIVNYYSGYRVTQGWSSRHQAIDYGMNINTPLKAPADGTITEQKTYSDAGKRLTLTLSDGSKIYLAHLNRYVYKVGAKVKQGVIIAYSGNTGKTTGPHLHTFGVKKNGSRWNWILDAGKEEVVLKPGQRKLVAAGANVRATPSDKATIKRTIAGSTVVTPEGWINGAQVGTNSIWYRLKAGEFIWSGACTTTGTSGLKDLNPKPPTPPAPKPTPIPQATIDKAAKAASDSVKLVLKAYNDGLKK